MNVHDKIRNWLKELINDKIISSESEYNHKGLYLKYSDGEISATTETGMPAYNFLKSHVLGSE